MWNEILDGMRKHLLTYTKHEGLTGKLRVENCFALLALEFASSTYLEQVIF